MTSTASAAVGDCNNRTPRLLRRGLRRHGYPACVMTIGMSIFLIAIGAILKYAITADLEGIDIQTVGVILMVAGLIGLVISILYTLLWSSDRGAGVPPPPRDVPPRRDRY
jgi:Domain of unknown function (DUF6458)